MKSAAILLFTISLTFFSYAQQNDVARNEQNQLDKTRINELFDEIMKTLPHDAKERIKSAHEKGLVENNVPDDQNSNKLSTEKSVPLNKIDPVLPEQLKRQVEKAIKEIDIRNQERAFEFKEVKRKQQSR